MRPTFRSALVALVAVAALGAVTAASASAALPELNMYNTKGEKVTTEGTFLVKLTKVVLKSPEIIYEYGVGVGSIKGSEWTFRELDLYGPSTWEACTNAEEGSKKFLKTQSLQGRLGYINKEHKEAGLLLEPKSQPLLECTAVQPGGFNAVEKYKGSVIGAIGPVNKRGSTLELKYAANTKRQQLPEKFEGEEIVHHLELSFAGARYEPVGLETRIELSRFIGPKGEEVNVELKA